MVEYTPAEDAARYLLRIFVGHFHGQPGRLVRIGNFHRAFMSDGWQVSDYEAGVGYALAQGWIEQTDGAIRLTEVGFAAAEA